MENYKLALFIALAIIFGSSATVLTFYYSPPLDNFETFSKSMKQCEVGAKYLNEEDSATWKYKIDRQEGQDCIIDVTFLQSKSGNLDTEKFTGYSMECSFPKGVSAYPERNLDACHGRLKEEFQGLVIGKLQTYVAENLRGIDKALAVK